MIPWEEREGTRMRSLTSSLVPGRPPSSPNPPMIFDAMTDRDAHASRADPGAASLGKLDHASSTVARDLLSSPVTKPAFRLPLANTGNLVYGPLPTAPQCGASRPAALLARRHILVMPLIRTGVGLSRSKYHHHLSSNIPRHCPSHPARHTLPKHHQAAYTDCCPLPCDCALPANTTHQGGHSLQVPPSTLLHLSHQSPLTSCGPPPPTPLTCSCYPVPPPSMRSPKFQSPNTGMPMLILQG